MKKIVLGAILVLLIAIGGGVFYLLSNLDDLVKTAIETYGSQAAKTTVRVESVKIGLQDGSGAIRGLTVANPQGFTAPLIFSLGEVATRVELKSITEQLVVIEYIKVLAPEIFFELNAEGQTNLNVLKQKLSSGSSASAPSEPSGQAGGEAPKLLIRKLLFADGTIHARVVPLNKDYELKLPKIELANLGGQGGLTPAQISDQVLKILTERALAEIKKQGIDQYKQQLEAEVKKRLDVEKKKIEQKVEEKVGKKIEEKLGDKAGKQVGEALKGLFNK